MGEMLGVGFICTRKPHLKSVPQKPDKGRLRMCKVVG